jgi:hypothetical protein
MMCVNDRGGILMSNAERLERYVKNKKRIGQKMVSFFVDEKAWKLFKKQADRNKMTIGEYLKKLLNFK